MPKFYQRSNTRKFYPLPAAYTAFFFLVMVFFGCTDHPKVKSGRTEDIVAIVADDTIFVNDFIRRCEFNIRPAYCQSDGIPDKLISLNSLVGEKLLALEAGETFISGKNEKIRIILEGIKEQAMRETLISRMVVDQIHIPEDELKQAFINAQKTIYIAAVFVPSLIDIQTVYRKAQQGVDLEQLKNDYPGLSDIYRTTVKWGQMDAELQQNIFNRDMRKGSVIKPLKTENGYWLMKIISWKEEIELSPANRKQKLENIRSRLKDVHIRQNYREYVKQMMKGKRIDFYEDGWHYLLEILRPVYLKKMKNGDFSPVKQPDPVSALQDSPAKPLLSIDEHVWTVADFGDEIKKLPLVINGHNLTENNFPRQLQTAIAGLISNVYLTKKAYEKNLDRASDVKQEVQLWKTYLAFLYQRDRYLAENGFRGNLSKDYFDAFDKYLTPYLDSLKAKYDDEILYNPSVLEKIELTKIPMIAYKTGGTHRSVMPPFPLVTNSVKANYRRMKP